MNKTRYLMLILVWWTFSVPTAADEQTTAHSQSVDESRSEDRRPYVRVLGIAQDAGFPQAGCRKECCRAAWQQAALRRYASCLAIVDPVSDQKWLLDCTPDFRDQLRLLETSERPASAQVLDGIFLTHAHIGHYAGLIHLGREVMGADGITVYAMPRMTQFLSTDGPWDQLVTLKNITLQPMTADRAVRLNERLSVTPLLVPHRDEYSETVGFIVSGPQRRVLYLPDIDKWEKWDRSIERQVQSVDVAYLDGTFFGNGEIPGRDMSQIPHPFIEESLQRFGAQSATVRSRVRFIHLNHTNPALHEDSAARRLIEQAGCHMAVQGERQAL